MVDDNSKNWQRDIVNRIGDRFSDIQITFIVDRAADFNGVQFGLWSSL